MSSPASIKPTSIKLPLGLRARMQNLAAIRSRCVHEIMLQALEAFVSREKKREAIRQECVKAHEEYVLTGLHVTSEEVDAWVDQLLEGKTPEMPACHV